MFPRLSRKTCIVFFAYVLCSPGAAPRCEVPPSQHKIFAERGWLGAMLTVSHLVLVESNRWAAPGIFSLERTFSMKIDVRRRVDDNSARRHPRTTWTSRNPCGCISRNFCGSAKPAPAAQRPNVHRVFRTIPRAATLVSNRSVACEPQSFSTPPPFEPRIDRLHFVHHPVHSRHLLPSQGRIHLETSVDALGA